MRSNCPKLATISTRPLQEALHYRELQHALQDFILGSPFPYLMYIQIQNGTDPILGSTFFYLMHIPNPKWYNTCSPCSSGNGRQTSKHYLAVASLTVFQVFAYVSNSLAAAKKKVLQTIKDLKLQGLAMPTFFRKKSKRKPNWSNIDSSTIFFFVGALQGVAPGNWINEETNSQWLGLAALVPNKSYHYQRLGKDLA